MIYKLIWPIIIAIAFGLFAAMVFLFYAHLAGTWTFTEMRSAICWTTLSGLAFLLLHSKVVSIEDKRILSSKPNKYRKP
jgi:hypothetical protein